MPDRPPAKPIATEVRVSRDGVPLRYLRAPFDVRLNIIFSADDDPKSASQSGGSDEKAPAAALPPESLARLVGLEPQVMKWLAASDANKLAFVADPVAALASIDKKLDKRFIKQLQRTRRRPDADMAVDSRIRISQLRVAVEQEPVVPKPVAPKADAKTDIKATIPKKS
jgi:hypothetical protein